MSEAAVVPVTVVIAARDESDNVAACIDSVSWAHEVIVADHGSTDDTVEQASAMGVGVIDGKAAPTIGALRNLAIERATSSWILVVDADERGDAAFADAVREAIASARFDAFRVRRRNFFLGREVKHGGWERDRPIRLFRSSLRYDVSRVHEHVTVGGEVGVVASPLSHYPYPSLDTYFEKLDRYSGWWASDQFAKGRRTSLFSVLVRPRFRFLAMLLLRGGFLDGRAGLLLALLASMSVRAKYARLYALGRNAL